MALTAPHYTANASAAHAANRLQGNTMKLLLSLALSVLAGPLLAAGVVYEGGEGPGKGKHIVLVSGDEEYRSEEALPQLAKILAKHHGFKCTVLLAIDDGRELPAARGKAPSLLRTKAGEINPNISNIPGLEALDTADLMVIFTRFRDLPDDQMKHVVHYLESGKPIIGIRTATHAFNIKPGSTYAKYSYNAKDENYSQGFGRQVLGETWINHHGKHGSQSTRGILVKGQEEHPILRGIKDGDIWGPTDVYGVRLPLPGDSQPLVLGQVLSGMSPSDPPLEGSKNDPMMPIAWTKTYTGTAGNTGRVFCSTIGASNDLLSEGTRRLLVNACYWAAGLEDKIADRSDVGLVGDYQPSNFRFNGFKPGVKPAEHELK
jgi:trehalose utilization protein